MFILLLNNVALLNLDDCIDGNLVNTDNDNFNNELDIILIKLKFVTLHY